MRTTTGRHLDIVFTAFLAAVLAGSLGYFLAAAKAAGMVRAANADATGHVRIVSTHEAEIATVTIEGTDREARTFYATVNTRNGGIMVTKATDAAGNKIDGSLLTLIELVVEEYEAGLDGGVDEGDGQ